MFDLGTMVIRPASEAKTVDEIEEEFVRPELMWIVIIFLIIFYAARLLRRPDRACPGRTLVAAEKRDVKEACMRHPARLFPFLIPPLVLPLHQGHGGELLRQRAPHFLLHLFSKYEHVIMRSIDYLASTPWIHKHAASKRLVDAISRGIIRHINGEILTLEESRRLIDSIAGAGYTIAVGTCPCRRARNLFSDNLPNETDMVFGRWAEEYLGNYPHLYRRLDREEALELLEEFDRHGFVHQIYGFPVREDAAFVLCNCASEACIPLQAQRERGYPAFRRGRHTAAVDAAACLTIEECGACIARCPFGARKENDGKAGLAEDDCHGCGVCVATCRGGATSLIRNPGAQLILARNLVD